MSAWGLVCLFAFGAIFPAAPYLALSCWPAVIASLALSGVVLAAIGAGTSLSGRSVLFQHPGKYSSATRPRGAEVLPSRLKN